MGMVIGYYYVNQPNFLKQKQMRKSDYFTMICPI
jgi:hypothetical protein